MVKSQISHKYRTRMGAIKAGMKEDWQPNDLGSVLKEKLDVEITKSVDHDVTDWTGPWSSEMIDYMLDDISYMLPLDDVLDQEIAQQKQTRAAMIECNAVFAVSWMTYNGLQPDVEGWKAAIETWTRKSNGYRDRLQFMFPGVENLNSTTQLMRAMPKVLGAPIPNTRKHTLKQLAPHFKQIQTLLDYRGVNTRKNNWGLRYLHENLCPECFRFHADWRQIGAETARFSCGNPNLQQIPRAQEFRNLFVPMDGHMLVSLDYSAIEVVTAAVMAKCPNLLAACATGDPHSAGARMTLGLDEEQWMKIPADDRKAKRQDAKIVNFGLLFGGGPDALVAQARDLFDKIITREQAVMMIGLFYKAYPELKQRRNYAYRMLDREESCLDIRNMVGFRRYLEKYNRKPTSILNTEIQSSAGHGMKSSVPYLMECGLLPFLCAQIHDEFLWEFPDEEHEELTEKARACMIRGMRDVLGKNAPVIVGDSHGKVWTK